MSAMLSVDEKQAGDLTAAEREAWRAFTAGGRDLASPYFTLGFLDAAASARRDVRVLVIRRGGSVTGFLPLHAGFMGHARPLGGPLGDHHGLIAEPGSDIALSDVLKAGGVGLFSFFGALGGQGAFAPHALARDGSWVMDLSEGFEAYADARAAVEPKAFRNLRARRRKLESAEGGFEFRIDDRREDVFAAALAWKSAQYRRTGVFDAFSVRWTRDLLKALRHQDDCRLLVSSLEIGGKLAAAHVGMRSAQVLHYWFPVYDPEFSAVGPGLSLLLEIASAMPGEGVREIHLGPGDFMFKQHLGSWQFALLSGFAGQGAPLAVQRAARALELRAERLPLGPVSRLPGKAFRRIDVMAGFHAA
ncbi:GNAT family N-acetyltransferase [Alkalicaulis satelles]|uniref:GNAT family N-acetyltransferase n=1 Tax=Alkalicaulis satelles TaxID=2609175 RepID=A0A5M6ZIP9_9PROT|nr:GNAT family N-acetyltransferase [Alkalicaulis satelles]KAA5804706.1 GNAT family N-acetyltransferase [Alkalicaulis satelles]